MTRSPAGPVRPSRRALSASPTPRRVGCLRTRPAPPPHSRGVLIARPRSSQAVTPWVRARGSLDAAARTYPLALAQRCPPTPGQPGKQPFVIPIRLGLIGPDGQALPLAPRDGALLGGDTFVLTEAEATLVFTGIDAEPVPSLLRGFSAPVELDAGHGLSLIHI